MIHGRVVSNPLRSYPPERFPVWGQRWTANQIPHAASEFETRTFQITGPRLVQVAPARHSPSQFHATIEGPGQEDRGSLLNPIDDPFPSPSPSVQTYPTEPSSSSTSRVVHHSQLHPCHRDQISSASQEQQNTLHLNPVHRVPRRQNAIGPSGPLQVEPEFPPSIHHRTRPVQRDLQPLEYDGTLQVWRTPLSTSTHPRAASSRESHIATGQELLLPDTSHWQFPVGSSQTLTHTLHPDSSLYSERGYHPHPDHGTAGAYLIPAPSSSPSFAAPLYQDGSSSWHPESNMPVLPAALSLQNTTTTQWSSGSSTHIPEPSQAPGSSSDIDEEFRRLISGHVGDLSPLGVLLGTLPQSPVDGNNTMLEGGQSTQ